MTTFTHSSSLALKFNGAAWVPSFFSERQAERLVRDVDLRVDFDLLPATDVVSRDGELGSSL